MMGDVVKLGLLASSKQKSRSCVMLLPFLAYCCMIAAPATAAGWIDSLARGSDPVLGERPYLEVSPPQGLLQRRSDELPLAEKLTSPLAAGRTILHAAVSRDGSLLAFSDNAGTAALVRADTGALLFQESFVGSPPVFLDFSPDGRWLLFAPVPTGGTSKQPSALLLDLVKSRRIELSPSIVDWGFSSDSTCLLYTYAANNGDDWAGGSYAIDLGDLSRRSLADAHEHGLSPVGDGFGRAGLRALGAWKAVYRFVPTQREGGKSDARVRIVVEDLRSGEFLKPEAFDLASFVLRPAGIDQIKLALAKVKPGKATLTFAKAESKELDPLSPTLSQGSAGPLPALPRLVDYGSWHLIETRSIGDRRLDLLSEGKPEWGDGWLGIRVVLRDQSGAVLRDRSIPFEGGLETEGLGDSWFARINDEGKILIMPTEWSEGSHFIWIDPSLDTATLCSFAKMEQDGRSYVVNPSGSGFFISGDSYRLSQASWLGYSLGSQTGFLYRPPQNPTWYGDNLSTMAVTARHFILWGDKFSSVRGAGSGQEELSGALVYKADGTFQVAVIFEEGDSEWRILDSRTVWERPDGSLVFVETKTSEEAETRKAELPTMRVTELGPDLKLRSKLLPVPWAGLKPLPDGQALAGREGIRLVPFPGRGGWGGFTYKRPPSIWMVPFKLNPAGQPDPLQGFDSAIWIDDPLIAVSDKAWTSLGAAGSGRFLLSEGYESLGNPSHYGLLELPLAPSALPPGAAAKRDLTAPELSNTPWVDFKREAIELFSLPSELLVDTPAEKRTGRGYALPLTREGTGSGEDVAVLNDSAVRLRSQPATTGTVLLKLDKGAIVRILERGSAAENIGGTTAPWYKVRTIDGIEGWLFAAFLDERKR
jgi:hypothetical protein